MGSPLSKDLIEKLDSARIHYGLYAGAYVAAIALNRVPTDIDFLVADEDFDKLKTIFPNSSIKEDEIGAFLYPNDDHKIEFMSKAVVNIDDSHYEFKLTDLAWENISEIEIDGLKVKALNPADTILLKAMLQRESDKGKHDLEDIEALLKFVKIDKVYLSRRLDECRSDERLLKVLNKYNLL